MHSPERKQRTYHPRASVGREGVDVTCKKHRLLANDLQGISRLVRPRHHRIYLDDVTSNLYTSWISESKNLNQLPVLAPSKRERLAPSKREREHLNSRCSRIKPYIYEVMAPLRIHCLVSVLARIVARVCN